jgi:uncharacterized LabA/DUF88 family protein
MEKPPVVRRFFRPPSNTKLIASIQRISARYYLAILCKWQKPWMRTAIYVDGFNLYYGRLKGTPYKWLNIHKLFSRLVHEQNPKADIIAVRYYTGWVKGSISRHGSRSVQAQNVYHSALRSRYGPPVSIIPSRHTLERKNLMRSYPGVEANKDDRVEVWLSAEKQSDVRIALDAYRAACTGAYEQIVLVTNDSDLVPVVEHFKQDFPTIRRGVIIPRRENLGRQPAQGFVDNADWIRRHIRDEELAQAQFPQNVPTDKKAATKPDYW